MNDVDTKTDETLLALCSLLQKQMDASGPQAVLGNVIKVAALFIRACSEEGYERDLLGHIFRSIDTFLPPPPDEKNGSSGH